VLSIVVSCAILALISLGMLRFGTVMAERANRKGSQRRNE
jgi:hypothetical protein